MTLDVFQMIFLVPNSSIGSSVHLYLNNFNLNLIKCEWYFAFIHIDNNNQDKWEL